MDHLYRSVHDRDGAGVLDGKETTVNHMLLSVTKQVAPKVRWVERQWIVDG